VERLHLNGRVGLAGYIEDPAEAMRALDIVVHASTRPEPFGMVIAEAMACGRAVIATNWGGAKEVFEDQHTGLTYEAGDAAALACRIERLIRDSGLRRRLSAAARPQAITRYNPVTIAESFERLYRQLIRNAGCDGYGPSGVAA
jgi:glycosyltransferase involved in cell wall biosynthesis